MAIPRASATSSREAPCANAALTWKAMQSSQRTATAIAIAISSLVLQSSPFGASSLLKNLESGAFSVFLLGLRVGRSGCVRLLATVSRVVSGRVLRRQQFGNSDQIVSDQIEHEIGGDTGYAAMFGLAHRAVLLAPAEDAFGHRPARLRNAIAFVPRGASV